MFVLKAMQQTVPSVSSEDRSWRIIYLDKSPVFAEDADFDFVKRLLRERCVKTRIKKEP